LGNVYQELYHKGGYTFNAGTCPGVGISGHISGGGYGMLARLYGLAADQTVGIKVALYNGTVIKANANENSDLFWALRGGGSGSFGIVLEWEIKVFDIGLVSMFWIQYSKKSRFNAIKSWMNYFPNADDRVTTQLNVEKERVTLGGQFTGSFDEMNEMLQESGMLNFGGIIRKNIQGDCNALGAKAFTHGAGSCNQTWEYLTPNIYNTKKDSGKYKSDFGAKKLPDDGIKSVVDGISKIPSSGWIQFESIGGYIAKQKNETPYNHRDMVFSIQYSVALSKGESPYSVNYNWIRSFEASLKPYMSGHHYQNYPDLDLGPNYGKAYFGETNLKRLKQIKKKYYPFNVFRNEQSIPIE
jgi:hypothetical protein